MRIDKCRDALTSAEVAIRHAYTSRKDCAYPEEQVALEEIKSALEGIKIWSAARRSQSCKTCLSYHPRFVNSWCKAWYVGGGRYGIVDDPIKTGRDCVEYRHSRSKASVTA